MAIKDLSNTKISILKALSTGNFVSGEKLGEELGISRAAIAKHVKGLSAFGIDVFSVSGKGYKLAESLSLLDSDKIVDLYKGKTSLEVHSVIDSTNQYLMDKIRSNETITDGHTVVAECQLKGRGRRGRAWVSPFGSHVYLSRYYKSYEGLGEISGLSLAIGIAITQALNDSFGIQTQLKWPNDILHNGKKLAGVLVEAEGQSDGICHLIVGIGLNINMPREVSSLIDQPWVDLAEISGGIIDRNELIGALLHSLDLVMSEFTVNKLQHLHKTWNTLNAFKDCMVDVTSGTNVKKGKCIGIDESGALLLEDSHTGVRTKVFGGEVSVRKAK